MTLIVCVDDNNGMMFNNRRQSRDTVVIEKVLQFAEKSKLYISEYSLRLFPTGNIFTDYCNQGVYFIENPDLLSNEIVNQFQNIVIFRWNRDYPFDKIFDFDIQCYSMTLCEEFEGSSHEKITMEIYNKKG